MPTDRVHKAPHVNAMAHALHGGAAVLLLGGHYPGKVDSFGDTQFGETWALHASAGVAGAHAIAERTLARGMEPPSAVEL